MNDIKDVTIIIPAEKIKEALNAAVGEVFKSSYRNPFVDAIEEVLKENKAALKSTFTDILEEVMTSPEFKTKVGEVAMQTLVKKALNIG